MVPTLDLQHFILQARVLKLYREALRSARMAAPHPRAELRNAIREEIERNRNLTDTQTIRFLLSDGKQRLKSLKEMLEMQQGRA